LLKTASPLSFQSAGDLINYTFKLTNSGNVTLYKPYTVDDDKSTDESCPDTPDSIAPGEFVICTATYTITPTDVSNGSVTNVATATAQDDFDDGQDVVSNDDNETVVQGGLTTFIIEKIWNQGGMTDGIPVTGHLYCTGAVSTQQDVVFTATTDAVLFVYDIESIPEGEQVDCTVFETVPDGYEARYDCNGSDCGDSHQSLDHCFYPDVEAGATRTCTITNRPLPAELIVTKTWVIENANTGFDERFWIEVNCDSTVIGGNYAYCDKGPSCWAGVHEEAVAGSTEYGFTITKPNYPYTECVVYERNADNVVETENGCEEQHLGADESVECEIVNTVFFEGIPVLNRDGMAIMALLMLGIGFVGFRRLT